MPRPTIDLTAGLAAIPLALMSIAACTATGSPVASATAGALCTDSGFERYAGQPASQAVGTEILRQSGAASFRWLYHDRAVTMEYRAERVGVQLDAANRVLAVRCG